MIAEKPSLRERLGQLASDSLHVLNAQPQGAAQVHTHDYGTEVDSTHPLNLRIHLASDILKLNKAQLSFLIEAFRSPVASVNTATSGASSSSSSGASSAASSASAPVTHSHVIPFNNAAVTYPMGLDAGLAYVANGAVGAIATNNDPGAGHSHTIAHTHGIAHTHDVTPTLAYGIFEQASTLASISVKVNGADRTSALGGPFSADQSELALDPAWFTLGAWNTIVLTPASGLGRVVGQLTVISYIQSS